MRSTRAHSVRRAISSAAISQMRQYIDALRELGEIHEVNAGGGLEPRDRRHHPPLLRNRFPGTTVLPSKGSGGRASGVLGAPAGLSSRPGQSAGTGWRCPWGWTQAPRHSRSSMRSRAPRGSRQSPHASWMTRRAWSTSWPAPRSTCLKLPTPLIHDGDGGRYLNTWGTIVARSPDGSVDELVDQPDHVARPQQHGWHRLDTDDTSGTCTHSGRRSASRCPSRCHSARTPVIPFFAGMPLRDGVSEPDVVGGFVGGAHRRRSVQDRRRWKCPHRPRSSSRATSPSTKSTTKDRWPSIRVTSCASQRRRRAQSTMSRQ